ncbi:hypothetical protein CR513_23195, partial [Mucuna pruriens]
MAATQSWILHQMDLHNAFLHGDLDKKVYMQLPLSFSCGDSHKACKLQKSLCISQEVGQTACGREIEPSEVSACINKSNIKLSEVTTCINKGPTKCQWGVDSRSRLEIANSQSIRQDSDIGKGFEARRIRNRPAGQLLPHDLSRRSSTINVLRIQYGSDLSSFFLTFTVESISSTSDCLWNGKSEMTCLKSQNLAHDSPFVGACLRQIEAHRPSRSRIELDLAWSQIKLDSAQSHIGINTKPVALNAIPESSQPS